MCPQMDTVAQKVALFEENLKLTSEVLVLEH